MESSAYLWLEYLLRFAHVVAGIAWIGSSFYFIWLDSSFLPPSPGRKSVEGEVFMVHGGFYYQVEKRKSPPENFQSAFTGLNGRPPLPGLQVFFFLLFCTS